MDIYFITYHAEPTSKAQGCENFAGAYVNCYIESNNIYNALKKAEEEIIDAFWDNLEFVEAKVADEENIGKSGIKYYRQALIDKEVLVFHTYPQDE